MNKNLQFYDEMIQDSKEALLEATTDAEKLKHIESLIFYALRYGMEAQKEGAKK